MITLNIVSPEKELFSGDVKEIRVPGSGGEFTILMNHAPIVSSLEKGEVRYVTIEGVAHTLDILDGFVEASDNVVTLCIS